RVSVADAHLTICARRIETHPSFENAELRAFQEPIEGKTVMRGTPRRLALTALAIVLTAAGCQSSAKKHLYKAEDLFEKRDLKGAQAELRESGKEDPNLTDAHNSLARVDEYLHDYDEAGKEFMIASQQDPGNQKTMAKARYYR